MTNEEYIEILKELNRRELNRGGNLDPRVTQWQGPDPTGNPMDQSSLEGVPDSQQAQRQGNSGMSNNMMAGIATGATQMGTSFMGPANDSPSKGQMTESQFNSLSPEEQELAKEKQNLQQRKQMDNQVTTGLSAVNPLLGAAYKVGSTASNYIAPEGDMTGDEDQSNMDQFKKGVAWNVNPFGSTMQTVQEDGITAKSTGKVLAAHALPGFAGTKMYDRMARGGKMGSKDIKGNMPNSLTDYNNGNKHNNGGIPVPAYNAEVEKGETKLNSENYVFSDRAEMKLTKSLANKHNIPTKYVGKKFSDISKEIEKKYSEKRPNDLYSNNAKERDFESLIKAQEEKRAKIEEKNIRNQMPTQDQIMGNPQQTAQGSPRSGQDQKAYGGSIYPNGGDIDAYYAGDPTFARQAYGMESGSIWRSPVKGSGFYQGPGMGTNVTPGNTYLVGDPSTSSNPNIGYKTPLYHREEDMDKMPMKRPRNEEVQINRLKEVEPLESVDVTEQGPVPYEKREFVGSQPLNEMSDEALRRYFEIERNRRLQDRQLDNIKFAKGGKMKYQTGGDFQDPPTEEEQKRFYEDRYSSINTRSTPMDQTSSLQASDIPDNPYLIDNPYKELDKDTLRDRRSMLQSEINSGELSQAEKEESLDRLEAINSLEGTSSTPRNQRGGNDNMIFDKGLSTMQKIAPFIKPAVGAATMIGGPEEADYRRVSPDKVDYEEAREMARRQTNLARARAEENIRQNANTAGQALIGNISADIGAQRNLTNTLMQSEMQERNKNVGIANRADRLNARIARMEDQVNAKNRAMFDQNLTEIAGDVGSGLSGIERDRKAYDTQNDYLNMQMGVMKSRYPNYDPNIVRDEEGNIIGYKQEFTSNEED